MRVADFASWEREFPLRYLLVRDVGDEQDWQAVERLAAALRARTRFAEPERLAAALPAVQGPCGAPRWRGAPEGARVNDGAYSPRQADALPAVRQQRITAAPAAR
ncbi:hypothetical protein ACWEO1_13935 [Kitasatospora cineracea]